MPVLLQQLEPLRACMAVRLPESVAGKEVPADTQPVLMLQLRRSGALDVSIQVRDRNQMLHAPGEGLARIHEKVDGEPVQFVRDIPTEIRRAQDIVAELQIHRGLPLSRWSWRMTDGDAISNLLHEHSCFSEIVKDIHEDSDGWSDATSSFFAEHFCICESVKRH